MMVRRADFLFAGGRGFLAPACACLASCILACALLFAGSVALADERVPVRTGEHPGFSRLVFDWAEKVDYSLTAKDSRVTLGFSKPATINLAALKAARVRGVSDLRQVEEGGNLVLAFRIREGGSVSHFRDGTKVVVDVAVTPAEDTPVNLDDGGTSPDLTPQKRPDQPAAPAVLSAPVLPVEQESVSAPIRETGQKLTRPRDLQLNYTGAPLVVRSEPVFNGVRLTYPLTEPLPAAIFQRAGFLWVIFERYRPVDHAGLGAVAGKRLRHMEQIAHPNATILRYRIVGGQHVVAHRRDSAWIVELKENQTAPRIPLEIGQQRYNGGLAVFLPVSDVGSRIDIVDPEVGDTLTVVPVLPAGRGVGDDRRFAQFQLMRSAQGVAAEILADGVRVERFRNGVVISTDGGLALSPDRNAPSYTGLAENAGQESAPRPERLIDLERWKRGGDEAYTENQQELLHRLSMAPDAERNGVRWDLARFYLAHGMTDQALGILDIMVANDADLLDNPEFRATRGVAYIDLRRYEAARNDLAHKGLDAEADAYLWRARAAAGLGQWQDALAHYRRGADQLSGYPEQERIAFEMAALRAARHLGDSGTMQGQIDMLNRMLLSPGQSAKLEYLRAQRLLIDGDREKAARALANVEEAGQRPSAARASLSRIELQLEDGAIGNRDAIDHLERLRFSWRGDEFELDLLDRLGRLYIDEGEYRTGFAILRQAVAYFPKSPRTRDITTVMSDAFQNLFLNGEADAMPPIEALALYYDFRELTPLGTTGDKMIRRLVDRLVAVDLLDRAGDLLEHQVRYRLEGVAQAQVASRLTMIYLLDRKPEKALAVLRATRQTIMPDDIELKRRHLEARALIDLKRYEEAEVLLEGDRTERAELLRADLYWNAGQWAQVVAIGDRLLGRRWESGTPLSNDERRQILRMAVAQSLDDNAAGLESIRERYSGLMDGGAYATAFDVITARQDPSEREIKDLTESIASVNRLESFMASYRDEFSGS